jgi:hypothetical protein
MTEEHTQQITMSIIGGVFVGDATFTIEKEWIKNFTDTDGTSFGGYWELTATLVSFSVQECVQLSRRSCCAMFDHWQVNSIEGQISEQLTERENEK